MILNNRPRMTDRLTRTVAVLAALTVTLTVATPSPAQEVAIESNPSIVALQESDPRSPEQLMFAIQVALGFDRLDVVERYAEQLIALMPDDAAKVALHKRFGTSLFVRLGDRERMGDEIAEFANSVITAAGAAARAEDRLRQLAVGAQSDDEATRRAAVLELLKAGQAAAPIVLNAISQASTDVQRGRLETTLVAMGRDAVRPLIGALESDNAAVVTHSANALARLDAKQAIPYLVGLALSETHPSASAANRALKRMVGVAPTLPEGVLLLRRKIDAMRRGDLPDRPDSENMITVFRWNNDANTIEISKLPREVARYDAAAQLSRDLARLSERPIDQLDSLIVQLQDAQLKAGLDQPLDRESALWKRATTTKPEMLETAMIRALDRGWTPAATAAIEAMGESGEVNLLDSPDGRPSPLAEALTHPNRRVRYAAARAIMQLDPKEAYAGSSNLLDALQYFIRATGNSRVLVGHPNTAAGRTVIGLVRAQGYEGASINTGRDVIRFAQQNPDYEVILLSSMLNKPSVGETIDYLRQDPRTAMLPIGVMAHEDAYVETKLLANEDSMTLAMPRFHSVAGAAIHMARLEALVKDLPPQSSRVIQAEAALRMLLQIASDRDRYSFYEIFRLEDALSAAVQQPVLSDAAAAVLAQLGTARAQRLLLTIAQEAGREPGQRLAALAGLRKAVELRGLQMTNREIKAKQRELRNSPLKDELSIRIGDALLKLFVGEPIDETALEQAAAQ